MPDDPSERPFLTLLYGQTGREAAAFARGWAGAHEGRVVRVRMHKDHLPAVAAGLLSHGYALEPSSVAAEAVTIDAHAVA